MNINYRITPVEQRNLSRKIQQAIAASGKSATEVGRAIGARPQQITNWSRGHAASIPLECLLQLEEQLGPLLSPKSRAALIATLSAVIDRLNQVGGDLHQS